MNDEQLRELVPQIQARQILDSRLNDYTLLSFEDQTKDFLRGHLDDLASGEDLELAKNISNLNDEQIQKLVENLAQRNQQIFDSRLADYEADGADETKRYLSLFFQQLTYGGQAHLAQDVLVSDEMFPVLVKSIDTGLLIPFKKESLKTSGAISPSPRPGLENSISNLRAQLRDNCLLRDGNKCVVTKRFNAGDENLSREQKKTSVYLDAAHIIPWAFGSFTEGERDMNTEVWVNINRYFPELRVRLGFNSEHLNSEANVMMLWRAIHDDFGPFNLIFEATSVANQYRIKTFDRCSGIVEEVISGLETGETVTFVSHDERYPLPDPTLLRIHAAIGNFLHLSGAGERIDKVLRDLGECGGLASDGSTNIERLLSVSGLSLLDVNIKRPKEYSAKKPTRTASPSKQRGGAENRKLEGY